MCTVKDIQEAIRDDLSCNLNMESGDIERALDSLPFSECKRLYAPSYRKHNYRTKNIKQKS